MTIFPNRPKFEALLPDEIKDGVQLYVFTEDFVFSSPLYGTVVIPAGYKTDFASIPGSVKAYIDDDSPQILCPSCVHDFRYFTHAISRAEADEELRCNMLACGARAGQARVVWGIVRAFGGSHW